MILVLLHPIQNLVASTALHFALCVCGAAASKAVAGSLARGVLKESWLSSERRGGVW